METGIIGRPAAVPDVPAPPRAESLAQSGAVRTELAPEASVQQAGAAQAVRFEPSEDSSRRAALDAAVQDVIRRNITVDPRTRELVCQTVSKETGEVVRQVPVEAMLRLRAYVREMREAEDKGRGGGDVPRVEKIA